MRNIFSECQKGKKQKAKSWSDSKLWQKLEECHEFVRKTKNGGGIPRNVVRTFVQGIRVKIRPSTRKIGPSLALFVSPLRPCNPCDTGNSSYYGGHKSESRQILFSFVLSLMTGVVRYMFFLSFFCLAAEHASTGWSALPRSVLKWGLIRETREVAV